jgi:hypothetical protein
LHKLDVATATKLSFALAVHFPVILLVLYWKIYSIVGWVVAIRINKELEKKRGVKTMWGEPDVA